MANPNIALIANEQIISVVAFEAFVAEIVTNVFLLEILIFEVRKLFIINFRQAERTFV